MLPFFCFPYLSKLLYEKHRLFVNNPFPAKNKKTPWNHHGARHHFSDKLFSYVPSFEHPSTILPHQHANAAIVNSDFGKADQCSERIIKHGPDCSIMAEDSDIPFYSAMLHFPHERSRSR